MKLQATQGSVIHLGVDSRETEGEGKGGQEEKRALIQGARPNVLWARLR